MDIYDRCIKTIEFETNESTAAGLTAERAVKVSAPRIKECFSTSNVSFYGNLRFSRTFFGNQDVTVVLKAVNICMGSDRYGQSRLDRYGKPGYL